MVDFSTCYIHGWYDLIHMKMDKDGFVDHIHDGPLNKHVLLFNLLSGEDLTMYYREDLDKPFRAHPYNVLLILCIDDSPKECKYRRALLARVMKTMWSRLPSEAIDTIKRSHGTIVLESHVSIYELETPQVLLDLPDEIQPSSFSQSFIRLITQQQANP